jgi:hypothetical protein
MSYTITDTSYTLNTFTDARENIVIREVSLVFLPNGNAYILGCYNTGK